MVTWLYFHISPVNIGVKTNVKLTFNFTWKWKGKRTAVGTVLNFFVCAVQFHSLWNLYVKEHSCHEWEIIKPEC